MATFNHWIDVQTNVTGQADALGYKIYSSDGVLRLTRTGTMTEDVDFDGDANTGSYAEIISINTAWPIPLRVVWTVDGLPAQAYPAILFADRAYQIADGYTAAHGANLDAPISGVSLAAAAAVWAYLIENGVPAAQIMQAAGAVLAGHYDAMAHAFHAIGNPGTVRLEWEMDGAGTRSLTMHLILRDPD